MRRPGIAALSLLIALSGCAEANVSEVPLPPVKPTSLGAVASTAGGLCGDPRLKGERIGRLTGKIAACGVQDAIRLTHVSGIALRAPARVNCDTARTFADWLTGPANASARRSLGSPIRNVRVVASYACRSRNNRPGARLSEHAFGRAIDVGGVTLANGREISVLENWGKGSAGAWLREIWRAACGPFKTVLGPDGDRFHKDHFHFDVAQRRSTFCR